MEKENGVWRTIRGRRIFIASGQSLSEAMSKSGKFDKITRKDVQMAKKNSRFDDKAQKRDIAFNNQRRGLFKKINEGNDKAYENARRQYKKAYNKQRAIEVGEKDDLHYTEEYDKAGRDNFRITNVDGKTRVERNIDNYNRKDRKEANREALQKKLADFKAKKQSNIRDIEYTGQDNKTHKMKSYDYPGKDYEDYLTKKYGTYKEEDVVSKNKDLSIKKLREDYEKKKEVDSYNKTLEKMKKNNPDIDNYLEKNKDNRYHLTDEDKVVNENELYKEYRNEMLSDMYDADTTYEDWKNGIVDGKNSNVKTFKELSDRDVKDLFKQLNDEGSDFMFDDDVKIEDGKVKTNVSVFMPNDDENSETFADLTTREIEIPISENETYSSLEEKIRDWQDRHSSPDSFYGNDFEDKAKEEKIKTSRVKKDKNDWLPKATEIKEQGKSNRKEVSDNIQAHILSYYDSPQDFVEQMDVFDNLPTTWHRGEEMAKQGFYSIYYDDQRKFLDDLKINPSNKKFSDDKVFKTYTSLIGRESAKLYDKIKKHQAETINNYKKRKGK